MDTLTAEDACPKATASTDSRRAYVLALIPAHNEAERIAAAVAGLLAQRHAPDKIVVVADNCTDDTARIAAAAGAEVFATSGNTHKKAGALNQALEQYLPWLAGDDLVLVQDADTVPAPTFAAAAAQAMGPRVGAVGGIFYGERGGGLLGQLQRMEFSRYAREIERRNYRADVLTGTATLFRASVLSEVGRARRSGAIGGGSSYYSLASLTEDDEMTKAVKTLRYRTVSPAGCEVVTEVMDTVPKLWHQRLRWQRGALENLRDYGWTQVTRPYIVKQALMGLSSLALLCYLLLMVLVFTTLGGPAFSPFWTSIGLVFVAEKAVTVWRLGWKARGLALVLVVELAYDMFQHLVYFRSLWDSLWRRTEQWRAT